jgi:triacylglycerol lipase
MYIDSKGRVRDVLSWRRAVDRLRGFLRGLRRFRIDRFSDHSIEQYISYLHAAVQKRAAFDDTSRFAPLPDRRVS